MKISNGTNFPVQKIKDRLSIEEVISSYIPLVKVGNTLKARCPFHNEKTPSFFVSNERNSYYCFGCSKGGDIFSFVQEFEGLDFKGALKLLAERANVPLEDFEQHPTEDKDVVYKIIEEATMYFQNNLSINDKALSYLKIRGIEEKTISMFRLGFAKNDWRSLTNYLRDKGYSFESIEKAGLAKKKDEQSKIEDIYDRFRSRIMFPIMDSSGRVIAFSGRYFKEEERNDSIEPAKYLNSPETIVFTKSNVLYGLHLAKESIRKNNFSILVEGQFDLLMSSQAGFRNTVATSGTALSESLYGENNNVSNLGLIKRLSNNLLIAFDGDNAGLKAIERGGKIALGLGMDVKVVSFQNDTDPADFILKEGVEKWREAVKTSKHIVEFFLDEVIRDFSSDIRKIGQHINNKIFPFILLLQSAMEKSHFLKLISTKTGIDIESLRIDLNKKEQEINNNLVIDNSVNNDILKNEMSLEEKRLRRLFGILFFKEVKNNFDLKNVLDDMKDFLNQETIDKFFDKKGELLYEVEMNFANDGILDKELDELILNHKENFYKNIRKEKQKELTNLSKEEQSKVLSEINDLNIKLEKIKKDRL